MGRAGWWVWIDRGTNCGEKNNNLSWEGLVRYWWTSLAVQNQVFLTEFDSPLQQDAQNWPHILFSSIDAVQISATRPCPVGHRWLARTCFQLLLSLSDHMLSPMDSEICYPQPDHLHRSGSSVRITNWGLWPCLPRKTSKHKDFQQIRYPKWAVKVCTLSQFCGSGSSVWITTNGLKFCLVLLQLRFPLETAGVSKHHKLLF